MSAYSVPCDCVGSKEINVHIIISLDHKLSLLTEGADPELPKHALVGEVLIGVLEPSLKAKKFSAGFSGQDSSFLSELFHFPRIFKNSTYSKDFLPLHYCNAL